MAQVTSPIILDSTGQQIHSDLQQIKNVLTTPSAAADITFDNTGTGMQADDVQDAITELKSNLTDLEQVSYKTGTSAYSQHLGNFAGDFDNYAYRVGNIVYFNLFLNSIGSNLPIGTAFATFVEEFRPNRRVPFYCTIYHTNAIKHIGVAIGTDGTITANQVISSNFVISGSFPIG